LWSWVIFREGSEGKRKRRKNSLKALSKKRRIGDIIEIKR